jgi:hypothetical protein
MGVLNEKRCKNIYNNEANQNNCKETDSSIIECLKKEGPTSEASNPTTKFHGPKDTKNLYTNEEFKWDILIHQWRGIGNDSKHRPLRGAVLNLHRYRKSQTHKKKTLKMTLNRRLPEGVTQHLYGYLYNDKY